MELGNWVAISESPNEGIGNGRRFTEQNRPNLPKTFTLTQCRGV